MKNMDLYEKFRAVPDDAKKTIAGGHLKGMTDINPMLRIKQLTAAFGPCGIGWWTRNVRYTKETANPQTGEIPIFCELELWYKVDGQECGPVYGCGGNALMARQRDALYTNDEAYKMAYTDAISVACKSLGMCADVYWQNDRTKYTLEGELDQKPEPKPATQKPAAKPVAKQEPKPAASGFKTQDTVPPVEKKPVNSVQGYLTQEIAKVCQSFKTNNTGFMNMWKGLSEGGVPNIPAYGTPSINLTMDQAKALIEAIWANFEPAEASA